MAQDQPVGALLREWRKHRGLSQLDLAIQAEVSTRHVSFVETGRTLPSRSMVLHLAKHLRVPLRQRNRLLVAAGYAPVYQERPLDGPDLAMARETIQQVLHGHEPYPALALDRRWNILLSNAAAGVFLEGADPALLGPPVNMMLLGLHPDGLAPRLLNLPEIRGYLLPRLAQQVHRSGDPDLSQLYEELLSYGPPVEPADPDPAAVALTIRIDHHGTELRLFSTVTTFGTAFDITLSEIAMESYFPADEATAAFLRARRETALGTAVRTG
ncbi:transcriptional regulator with XRE-family HTH domain [Lipingzhangella halophila]|uniref:Transcriptional regulator with XRE-family HTH domain n=1 Tax=Lipingzhangella halophila TaxID=1783352 RepID=A0A7W7RJ86_9ACTN|nr:helix-turn-helix transcriptional regulator [Lipingzhangella halophila]MBB4932980.1 transcriptional regulator with XRE-family HTH domain [Lipingzhangella halophila]